jgi:hypothetical protein
MSIPMDAKPPHDACQPVTEDAERVADDATPLDEGDVVVRVAAGELVSRVASRPRSRQRLRTRSTFITPASRSSTISWSVRPSPAFNTILGG